MIFNVLCRFFGIISLNRNTLNGIHLFILYVFHLFFFPSFEIILMDSRQYFCGRVPRFFFFFFGEGNISLPYIGGVRVISCHQFRTLLATHTGIPEARANSDDHESVYRIFVFGIGRR